VVVYSSKLDERKERSFQRQIGQEEDRLKQEAAETRVRLPKDPQLVDGIYLKTSERIAVLGVVMVMALLLYGILEDRVRRNLEVEDVPPRVPNRPGTTSGRARCC